MQALGHRDSAKYLHCRFKKIFQIIDLEIHYLQMKLFSTILGIGVKKKANDGLTNYTQKINIPHMQSCSQEIMSLTAAQSEFLGPDFQAGTQTASSESHGLLRLFLPSVNPSFPSGLLGRLLTKLLHTLPLTQPVPFHLASPFKARWTARPFSLTKLCLQIHQSSRKGCRAETPGVVNVLQVQAPRSYSWSTSTRESGRLKTALPWKWITRSTLRKGAQ